MFKSLKIVFLMSFFGLPIFVASRDEKKGRSEGGQIFLFVCYDLKDDKKSYF